MATVMPTRVWACWWSGSGAEGREITGWERLRECSQAEVWDSLWARPSARWRAVATKERKQLNRQCPCLSVFSAFSRL